MTLYYPSRTHALLKSKRQEVAPWTRQPKDEVARLDPPISQIYYAKTLLHTQLCREEIWF